MAAAVVMVIYEHYRRDHPDHHHHGGGGRRRRSSLPACNHNRRMINKEPGMTCTQTLMEEPLPVRHHGLAGPLHMGHRDGPPSAAIYRSTDDGSADPIGDLTQRDRLEAQRPGISFFFDQQHNILVPAARCRNIVAVGVTVGKLSSRQFRRAPALKSAMVTFRLLLPNTKTL